MKYKCPNCGKPLDGKPQGDDCFNCQDGRVTQVTDPTDIKKMQNELRGIMLMKLIQEHKERCDGECDISVFLFVEVYEMLMGRKVTETELKCFL